jgi:dienelactone hydrolase
LVGISRGVEAALLTAAHYDGTTSVVGYAGGGAVRHGVTGIPPRAYSTDAAWTYKGTPVAPTDAISRAFDVIDDIDLRSCSVDEVSESVSARLSEATLDHVLIPVEEIDGPVLHLAGLDDQQWPSATVAILTVDRLRRRGSAAPFGLKMYCRAGHVFGVPYADYSGSPISAANGGTPMANAAAAADSWPIVLDYLAYGIKD